MSATRAHVDAILEGLGSTAVALSGGVDSMTLAALAHQALGAERTMMLHAISPAVPPEASQRVQDWAAREGWRVQMFDAGEFSDPDYLRNPSNRCFFCKANLYGSIRARTSLQIVSGTNLNDLSEYRPGLAAARDYGVRHPFVEAEVDKNAVRVLARELGMSEVAELPAGPCLASRVQTGIPIDPATLRSIHAVETLVHQSLRPSTVRCRVRPSEITIELDSVTLEQLSPPQFTALRDRISELYGSGLCGRPINFKPYRTGSAFVLDSA